VILTKDALQITPGEENITNAFLTRYHRFFSLVNAYGGDAETRARFAVAQFSGKPVGLAVSRANRTIAKHLQVFQHGCYVDVGMKHGFTPGVR
jgi:hypothetical protein